MENKSVIRTQYQKNKILFNLYAGNFLTLSKSYKKDMEINLVAWL